MLPFTPVHTPLNLSLAEVTLAKCHTRSMEVPAAISPAGQPGEAAPLQQQLCAGGSPQLRVSVRKMSPERRQGVCRRPETLKEHVTARQLWETGRCTNANTEQEKARVVPPGKLTAVRDQKEPSGTEGRSALRERSIHVYVRLLAYNEEPKFPLATIRSKLKI